MALRDASGYQYFRPHRGREETGSFCCCMKQVWGSVSAARGLMVMGDQHALLKLILLSLLCVSKALFHSGFNCVVLPLVTQTPECSGRKGWVFCS